MTQLKTAIEVETAFNVYRLTEQIGEGGAGRVYGGNDADNKPIALKLLTSGSSISGAASKTRLTSFREIGTRILLPFPITAWEPCPR